MRKEIVLPALALGGGTAGFFLRRWELATAFEPDTGLAIAGMPATWALVGFTVLMVAALALLARGKHNSLPSYDAAFSAKGNTLYMFFMTASAGLFALAGAMGVYEVPGAYAEAVSQAERHGARASMLAVAPRAVLAVLCLASAWALFQVGRNNYRGEGRGRFNSALLVPSYTACMWLIVSYQQRSGDPVVLDYAWQLFAVIAAVLGTYFMAGFAFERAKVFRASFAALCGVYFILVTLADAHRPSALLLCGAFFLYLLPSAAALLFNAGRPMLRRMPGSGQEDAGDPMDNIDLEDNTNE